MKIGGDPTICNQFLADRLEKKNTMSWERKEERTVGGRKGDHLLAGGVGAR